MREHVMRGMDNCLQCVYCATDLPAEGWNDEFHGGHRYRTITCNCGRKTSNRFEVDGSGQEEWKSWVDQWAFGSARDGSTNFTFTPFERRVKREHARVEKHT